jgi:four helix bundle protein
MRMSRLRSYKDLRAWQEAFALHLDVRRLTRLLAPDHASLGEQMRRASRGVHSAIAEGHGRPSDEDFARYLVMARGSLHEVEADVTDVRVEDLAPGDAVTAVAVRIPRVEQLIAGLLRHLAPPPEQE